MATCCQEQEASLHEPQHPFVVHSIPLWVAVSLCGPQHSFMGCSIPSWVTESLHGFLPHLHQGYGAGDTGQDSTVNLSREMGLFSLERPLPIFEFAAVTNSPVPTVHILSQNQKNLNWDSEGKKESDPFPAARLKVLKGWSNTAWGFFFLLLAIADICYTLH